MSETLIRFEHVTKRFGAHVALDDVSIDVFSGEILVVIGRSGSGKTTMLRCVNALVVPDSGRVFVEGRTVASGDVVASRRRIGYVIQSGGLFPHMTVAQNVSILGRAAGDAAQRRASRVAEVLATVGLETLESRYPSELSGGQRQRVGIARALYMDPPILLLDEPFAAVDPLTRMDLQDEFSRLHHRLGKTMVFVTHDVDEALYLGDRVAVFDAGRLVQTDAPDDLRRKPATEYIARFLQRRRARGDA